MKVLGDTVLIQIKSHEEQKKGSLFIPANVAHKLSYAEVLAVGRGVISAGKIVAPEVKVGDTVIFNSSSKMDLDAKGLDNVFLIKEAQILAILDKEEVTH